MSIIPRPLKQVLGKIIPFSQADKIPTFNLGSGTADSTTYLRGDGTWSSVTGSASNKMYTVGRNSTGSTLYKGTIVYISGSTGNRPNFVKAQANSEATSAGTFGVIEADIPNNSDGNCVTIGTIDNLDTRTTATYPFTNVTLADGDTIYLHPTIAGYITNVKPSAPNHLVYIGKVVRTHPTLGTIVYRIQNGYEIDELHDVAISSPTNGQILQYESATSLWKNVTPSSGGLTVGTTSITSGTAGRVLFEDATNKLNESANFYWDNTNSRLSVGMGSSPTAIVDIKAGGATSTDYGLRVRNSAATKDLLLIRGNGDHELGATGSPSLSLIASSGFSYPSLYFKGQGGTERTQIYMTSNTFSFICTTSDTLTLSLNTTAMTFREGLNQVFGTTTGTKLGTSTSQKIGFWNATPIVQPTTAIAASTFVSNTSLIANDTATFDGYTIGQVVKALRNIGILS